VIGGGVERVPQCMPSAGGGDPAGGLGVDPYLRHGPASQPPPQKREIAGEGFLKKYAIVKRRKVVYNPSASGGCLARQSGNRGKNVPLKGGSFLNIFW
jgi:hypothetical protein